MAVKVNLSFAIVEYTDHLKARGLAEGTIRHRRAGLELFMRVTGDIYVENVTSRHVDQVFATYPWAASSRNNRLSHYRSFFAWCRSRHYMGRDKDPTFGWRNVRVPEKARTRIPVAEWPRLFNECLHPQETIVMATGLYLFLRSSEQQLIQIKHVHLSDGEIEIYRPKTKEHDTMPISSELDGYLRSHLEWLAAQGCAEPDHYLIPTRNRDLAQNAAGRLMAGTGTINPTRSLAKPHRTVQRVLDRAGYPTKGEGEHTLRRSGARAYFDALSADGYDGALRRVQAMLGHKNSIMTEIYLGLDLDRRLRNEDIKGKPMFPHLVGGNVVAMREAR